MKIMIDPALEIKIPSFAELEAEFNYLKNQEVENIPGVLIFDSGIPGPCVGVTMMTHGNEPSGLACSIYFRNNEILKKRLKRGRVILILNNLEAGEKYFEARRADNQQEILKSRFIDINMNRLPADLTAHGQAYEVIRAKRLLPLWKKFDYGIDVHSTTQKSEPMIIPVGHLRTGLFKGFPMENIISNIENVQIGKPAAAFYGEPSKKIPTVIVETGSHGDPDSFVRAIDSVNHFLCNIGLVDDIETPVVPKKCKHYRVSGTLMVPNSSYTLTRVFKTYDFVKKGELLADGDRGPILMPFDGHALMGPKDTTIRYLAEEVLFLTEPVKEIVI